MTDMTKRRDDLAEEICINPEFNTEDLFISEVLEMNRIWGFKEGFDACYKEMQARHDSNAKSWEVAKEIEIGARFKGDYDKVCEERDSLKAQVERLANPDFENFLKEQLKTKDAVIDVAVRALGIVLFLKSKVHWVAPNNRDELRELLAQGEQALTQIKEVGSSSGTTKLGSVNE